MVGPCACAGGALRAGQNPVLACLAAAVLVCLAVALAVPLPALAAPGDWQTHTVSDAAPSYEPSIDDGYVAYLSFADPGSWLEVFDCADAHTERVAALGYPPLGFAIDDGWAVWIRPVDGVAQVFAHDLVAGTTRQISAGSEDAHGVDVDGGLAVWAAGEREAADLYLYDLAGGAGTRFTENAYHDGAPRVGDGLVVWEGRPGGGDGEIFVLDTGTRVITQLTDNTFADSSPRTSCGYVVWQAEGTGAGRDVVVRDVLRRETWAATDLGSDFEPAALVGRDLVGYERVGSSLMAVEYYLDERERDGIGSGGGDPAGRAALDLGLVAWREVDDDYSTIVLYDRATGNARNIDRSDSRATNPSADGGIVVWQRGPSESPEIRLLSRQSFSDVPVWHLHGSAIGELARRGVVSGFGGGAFGPDDPLWRQHFAKMLVLALQLPVTEDDVCPFVDVEISGHDTLYPDNYIAVAAARELTMGTGEGTFSPYAQISRAQVVTMVVRAIAGREPDLLRVPPAGYRGTWGAFSPTHAQNARIAEYNHLLDGLRMRGADPWGSMNRGECAQMLYNMVCYLGIVVPIHLPMGSAD